MADFFQGLRRTTGDLGMGLQTSHLKRQPPCSALPALAGASMMRLLGCRHRIPPRRPDDSRARGRGGSLPGWRHQVCVSCACSAHVDSCER